ncbi:MAG: AsmA-like C-terminal domain-containing protein [bacterium]
MPGSKFFKTAGRFALILLLLALVIPYLVDINHYKGYIEQELGESLGGTATIKKLKLFAGLGLGVQGTGLSLYSPDSSRTLFSAEKIILYFSLEKLLHGQIEIKSCSLVKPRLTIIRNPQGNYNLFPKKQPTPSSSKQLKAPAEKPPDFLKKLSIEQIKIKEGQLDFIDKTNGYDSFRLGHLFAGFYRTKGTSGSLSARFTAFEPVKGKIGQFRVKTRITAPSFTVEGLKQAEMEGGFFLEGLDFSVIKQYWLPRLPWIWLEKAEIDVKGTVQGHPSGDFSLKAEVKGKRVEFAYPEIFSNYLPGDRVSVKVNLARQGTVMDLFLRDIKVQAEGAGVRGSIGITDLLREEIAMDLDLKLTPFNAGLAKKYISYPVIPEQVNEFIRHSVFRGNFSGVTVKLKGSIDDIGDITIPGNEGVLQVSGQVKDGAVKLPGKNGEISDIAGSMLLKDGKIVLENVSALIGTSPVRVPALRIDRLYQDPEYHLKADLEIPFQHEFIEKRISRYCEPLAFAGTGALSAEITGPDGGWKISGQADLTKTKYQYLPWLDKPAGLSNRIDFSLSIPRKDRLVIKKFVYYSNKTQLAVTGAYTPPEYDLALKTESARLADIYPLISAWYAGKINPPEGEMNLQAALKQSPGNTLKNLSLKLTQGKISLKQSPVSLYGLEATARSTGNEKYKVSVSSGSGGYKELPFNKIRATAFYTPSRLSVDNFTSQVGGGLFSGKGTVSFNPDDAARQSRNKYEIDFHLKKGKAKQFLKGLKIGVYKEFSGTLDFSGHLSNSRFESRFSPGEFPSPKLYARLVGKGIIREKDTDTAQFDDTIRTREDLTKLLDGAGINERRPIFEAWSDSYQERLVEYPHGDFHLSLTNGRIEGYAALNKVLYLVNPDALLKSKSQDFSKKGYPYKSFKGTFKVNKGIFHTEDLLLDSNSWKILVLGDIDYPRENLDLKLYVQPLRMVDSMVEAIPLLGKVVKGKNRGLIEACFRVKGNYQKPDVSSTQMEGLVNKTLGIIGRFFTLPLDLFQKEKKDEN